MCVTASQYASNMCINVSTYVPISEKYETLSSISVAPTLIADGAELGDPLHALHPIKSGGVQCNVYCIASGDSVL
jgi:hypothetical protein